MAETETYSYIPIKAGGKPSYRAGHAKSKSESINSNLWDGLVACYPMSLGHTGNSLLDITSIKRHGTLNNVNPASGWVIDDGYWCLNLASSVANVEVSNFTPLLNSSGLSFSLWYWAANGAQSDTYACMIYHDDQAWGILQDVHFNKVRFRLDTTTGITDITSDDNFFDGGWHHLCCTWDGLVMKMYRDTILVNSASKTGTIDSKSSGDYSLRLATQDGTYNNFNGKLSDVYIYNRALMPSEISMLYEDRMSPFYYNRIAPFHSLTTSIPQNTYHYIQQMRRK